MRKTTTKAEELEVFAAMPQLYTARYANPMLGDDLTIYGKRAGMVRITLGPPRFKLPYRVVGDLRGLAPKSEFLRDPLPVFRVKYRTTLEQRGGARYFARRLEGIATAAGVDALVLLCFEDLRKPGLWCHRRLFAEWWRQQTAMIVPELPEEKYFAL